MEFKEDEGIVQKMNEAKEADQSNQLDRIEDKLNQIFEFLKDTQPK